MSLCILIDYILMEKCITLSVLLRQRVSIKAGQKFGWETKGTSLDFVYELQEKHHSYKLNVLFTERLCQNGRKPFELQLLQLFIIMLQYPLEFTDEKNLLSSRSKFVSRISRAEQRASSQILHSSRESAFHLPCQHRKCNRD